MILDEIFSGLDPLNIELIKDIILDLKRNGTTILFSTHVMEQAEKLCDHICMIASGQKVLDGSLNDVKANFGKNTIQIDIVGDGSFIGALEGVKNMTEFNNYIELTIGSDTDTNRLLKAVADISEVREIPCYVSVETVMACGMGACMGCAVETREKQEKYPHVCIDGPVFLSKDLKL